MAKMVMCVGKTGDYKNTYMKMIYMKTGRKYSYKNKKWMTVVTGV